MRENVIFDEFFTLTMVINNCNLINHIDKAWFNDAIRIMNITPNQYHSSVTRRSFDSACGFAQDDRYRRSFYAG